jgi:hypothetical protein
MAMTLESLDPHRDGSDAGLSIGPYAIEDDPPLALPCPSRAAEARPPSAPGGRASCLVRLLPSRWRWAGYP